MAGKVVSMVLMCVAVAAAIASQAESLSCGTVATNLYPCLNYVQDGRGGAPPMGCCDGIKSLYRAAATTADRRDVCNCMKNAMGSFPGVNMDLAASLPAKCGVNLPYKISPSIDCSRVQ